MRAKNDFFIDLINIPVARGIDLEAILVYRDFVCERFCLGTGFFLLLSLFENEDAVSSSSTVSGFLLLRRWLKRLSASLDDIFLLPGRRWH